MRTDLPREIEDCRIILGPFGSRATDGPNGFFKLLYKKVYFDIIASNGMGWEHVSVCPTDQKRCPTWDEMSHIKDLFWLPEEVVIEYHVAKSNHINIHPYVLHLWRPIRKEIPTPPLILV